MGETKNYFSIIIKIFLLLVGIADFIGILPSSLDILDKALTALVLVYFWLKLKPLKFLLGYQSKVTDKILVAAFYLFVIDTFVPLIPNFPEELAFNTSLVSITVGTLVIALIALYVSFKKIQRESLFHSFFSIIDRKDELFDKLSKKRFIPLKFIMFFIVMMFMSEYFFGLINQWFIVSLDKSLLIVAVLFAVKDIKNSKSEALNKIGNFDEWLLGTITDVFTNRKKFYLGLGMLLVLHYLSDLAVFFIPYLLPIAKDPYYFDLIGNPEQHLTIKQLLANETLTTTAQNIAAHISYFFSSLGILFLFLIPIGLIFLIVLKKDLRRMVEIRGSNLFLGITASSIIIFFIGMWTKPKVILSAHVVGVDFVTNTVSSASFLNFTALVVIIASVIIISLFISHKAEEAAWIAIFFASLTYLSVYSVNFFISYHYYYFYNIIPYFSNIQSYPMIFNSYLLIGLSFIFYVIGFIVFSYHAMRYILKNLILDILTNGFIIFTSLFVIISTMIMIEIIKGMDFVAAFTVLFSFLGTFLIFSYAFYKDMSSRKEYRDDFVLAIGIVEFIYLGLGALALLLSINYNLNISVINYFVPGIVTVLALFLVRFFQLKICFKGINLRRIIISLLIGVGFGLLFFLIDEPPVEIFSKSILWVMLFVVFVGISEELIYRIVIFRLAEKSFNFKTANVLQSVVFAMIHFLFFKDILNHYGNLLMPVVYFIALLIFSYVMGLLVGRIEKCEEGNVMYAIIAHIAANLILYFL
ncbi:MAG: CPBP family intramembrane glutamic endopeptidase [Nanoarchaeota archaeon]